MSRVLGSIVVSLVFTLGCVTKKVPYDYVKTGNALAQDGLYKEAVESYQKAIKQNKKNYVARRNLGIVYLKAGNYAGAIKHLEAVQGVFHNNFEALFYLGEAYRAKARYADAIFVYQKSIEVTPDEVRALRALAWSFFEVRNYHQGLKFAKRLVNINPKDAQSVIILSRLLIKIQKPSTALKVLGEVVVSKKSRMQPYFDSVKGDAYFAKGMVKQAKKYYKRALKEQPLLAGALLGYGKCLLDEGSTKPAITYLERAVRIRPKLTEAFLLLGRLYETSDPRKAIVYYNKFRKLAVRDPEYLSEVSGIRKKVSRLKYRK